MKQVPIVYFFQNEPKAQFMFFFQGEELIVKNILQQFPFKITTHHIRFKIFVQDIEPKTQIDQFYQRYAWFDISNPNAKVPVVNDTVFAKILILSDLSYSRIAKKMVESVSQDYKVGDLRVQQNPIQQLQSTQNKGQQSQSNSSPKLQQQQNQKQTLQQGSERLSNRHLSNQSNGTSQSGDLLEAFEKLDFKPNHHTQSQPISQADLDINNQNFPNFTQNQTKRLKNDKDSSQFKGLNAQSDSNDDQFTQFQQKPQQQQAKKGQDLFEFDTLTNKQTTVLNEQFQGKDGDLFQFDAPSQSQQQSNDQYEGLTDKQIVDLRVEQAAEGLQKIWQEEQDYNVLRQQAKDEVEPKILKWAQKNNVRNNLRLLLTTLTDVLWEGTNWQCSIGDLMTEGKVKLKYRQALLIVHPDKHNSTPPVQRYIAERVFYELNQAWNDEKNRS
ncbi:unnamed protein product (macronuclear) [Paramecium tetraurelia]|uniref:J domain-containing protein n=1 Tax=Paramecium tetraurelia TaxID=5888 RepID=A0EBH8_PARTE|nr:uncharacterized protein GSPATT00025379001 [Paramecium tetraurelia]CAK92645.1 unnamed protein product [Paramecium tetraurelia]|eukprot:XP_001460042.1 hypothetical protein (macronuclear) [Paramecium tetraurelia strain d4-2]